jgi:hypothetical protein
MKFLRMFQVTAVIMGLGVSATACHQNRQPFELATATAQADDDSVGSASARARDAQVVERRLDVYIGELFSKEQKALASKPPEAEAPSF